MIVAKPKDYLYKSELHLEVSPLYINRVLNYAEHFHDTVIMVHSHPFEEGTPKYSPSDNVGELKTSKTISQCLPDHPPVGSLLIGKNRPAARIWMGLPKINMLADTTILNGKIQRYFNHSTTNKSIKPALIDRQLRTLGEHIQEKLESLEIGIVGLGGTGSNIAEQLVRMGITKLKLVDHDIFEPSNWSRLYGSTWKNNSHSKTKVELISKYLKKINPKIVYESIPKSVMKKDILHTLSNCDLIFSCLDRQAPRAVLNELSYQCFIPTNLA